MRFEQAVSDLAAAREKRKELPQHRPASVVEEALKGVQQDRRYNSSNSCTDTNWNYAREFCKGFFDVRAELAAAVEDDRLANKIETLNRETRQLKEQGAGQEKDPQARMLSMLSGLELDTAQKVLIMFVAVLVELGAAFGVYLATGWAADGPSAPSAPRPTPRPATTPAAPQQQQPARAEKLPATVVDAEFTDVGPEPEPDEAPEPSARAPAQIAQGPGASRKRIARSGLGVAQSTASSRIVRGRNLGGQEIAAIKPIAAIST